MRSAVLVLALCGLCPLVYGACYQSILDKGLTHCQDDTDKTWHAFGSSWTNSKCMECSCNSGGMSCCDGLPRITDYPKDCKVKYNYKDCTFAVVKKNDQTKQCPFSAVLK